MQALHTLQASYIRERASARDIPGLDLARVRDPAERGPRIQHGFFFLSPSPSVVLCFRVHCNLQFIRACRSRQVLEQ
jgi:hypothetical protein